MAGRAQQQAGVALGTRAKHRPLTVVPYMFLQFWSQAGSTESVHGLGPPLQISDSALSASTSTTNQSSQPTQKIKSN